MNEHPATLLRCVVERITYQNPENGYSVLKVKVKGYNDLVTLVGNLLEVPVGSVLLCRGEWKVDKRYGSQFVAATWEETMRHFIIHHRTPMQEPFARTACRAEIVVVERA